MIGRSALLSDSPAWNSDKTGRNACGPVAIRIRQREFRSIQYQEYMPRRIPSRPSTSFSLPCPDFQRGRGDYLGNGDRPDAAGSRSDPNRSGRARPCHQRPHRGGEMQPPSSGDHAPVVDVSASDFHFNNSNFPNGYSMLPSCPTNAQTGLMTLNVTFCTLLGATRSKL